MNFHLVGGFLGSGKTTAIIQACRLLMSSGKKVGVITNDQGKYLVDTAFMKWNDVPTVDVTGGCFCCNYNILDSRLDLLIEQVHPDVVFAESVGSCVDLVATVMNPMRKYGEKKVHPASLTVFTDSRLLLRRLKGEEFPFSDEVTYIYDQQMEEAGILMVNKIDLLSPEELQLLNELTAKRHPQTPSQFLSSLDEHDIQHWISLIETDANKYSGGSLDLDYKQYSRAEQMMGWLDASVKIGQLSSNFRLDLIQVIQSILEDLSDRRIEIGHIKFLLTSASTRDKISITTVADPGWTNQIPLDLEGVSNLLINARAIGPVDVLEGLFRLHFENSPIGYNLESHSSFNPGEPKPTYRMNG